MLKVLFLWGENKFPNLYSLNVKNDHFFYNVA